MTRLIIALSLFFMMTIPHRSQAQLMAIGAGMYDQSIPQIVYSGTGITWSNQANANAFGANYRFSNLSTTTNPRIDFSIYGDGFTIYIFRNAFGSPADLCVNSVCSGISFYSLSDSFASVSVSGLGFGTHDVRIQKTSVTNTLISLDGLYVAPPAPQPTVIPPTPIVVITMIYPTPSTTQVVNIGNWAEATLEVEATEDPIRSSWDIESQSVAFEYRADAGQIVMTVILVIIAVVLLMLLVIVFRWAK